MIKTFLTLIAFIFLSGSIHAQDSIFKTNGSIVIAKILEIDNAEIKYKKYEFLDGPTYVESKTNIRSIRYSNGLKENFAVTQPSPAQAQEETIPPAGLSIETDADYYSKQEVQHDLKFRYNSHSFWYKDKKIGERSAQQIMMQTKDKDIINLVQESKDAHTLKFIGFGAIPLGIGALYLFANSFQLNGTLNSGKVAASGLCLIGAIACPIVSGIYSKKRVSYNKQAVKLYNERY